LHPWTGKSLLEFTNRQMLITRVYSLKRWLMGALAHWAYSLTLIYAIVAILVSMIGGDTWIELALITLVIPCWRRMKGAVRTVAVDELLPQWRGPLKKWNRVWMLLAPIVPFLFAWNFCRFAGEQAHALARGELRTRFGHDHAHPQPLTRT